ncbi:MAG: SBBP repeat-containing protein [Bacteroidetes bacterium]|nr:SBBP repeat-containing protein [Bacteroidota bacterium]
MLVIILYGVKNNNAQTFQWAKRMGAVSGQNSGNAITTDAAGNSYTTGVFSGTVDFDPGAGVFNLTSTNRAAFICKLNAREILFGQSKFQEQALPQGMGLTLTTRGIL